MADDDEQGDPSQREREREREREFPKKMKFENFLPCEISCQPANSIPK